MRIYLVRHGQSLSNAGREAPVDCELTDQGASQSAAVAAELAAAGVTLVLTSPYKRCLRTADAIRKAASCTAELLPAMHEHHHEPFPAGTWPLPKRSELAKGWPDFVQPPDMPEVRWAAVPEDRAGLWRRVSAAVRKILDRFGRDANAGVAVVTHHSPASVFVQAFCQWQNPLNVGIRLDNGCYTVLEVDDAGRRILAAMNRIPST